MKTSYSEINTYQRCPTKYAYAYIDRLQRKKRNVNLFNGINAHGMLQAYFIARRNDLTPEECWLAVEEYTENILGDSQAYAFDEEMVDAEAEVALIYSVIKRYIDQYSEEWTILHVEEEFWVQLGDNIVTFTPDLVVRDRAGKVWPVDHKTTSGSVETGIPFGDMQSLLYYAGVKAIYPETVGFLFNRLRKKLPTQPKLVKSGKRRVASLKNIDTTYEILRDFLKAEAPDLLNDPEHQQRLAELRDGGDRFFWTEAVYVNDSTISSILDDVSFVLNSLDESGGRGEWPRHLLESRGYKDCRKCEFMRLCQGEMLGWDTGQIIIEDYEPRDAKNPYESEE